MLQVHRISSARHRAGLRVATLAIVLAGVGGYSLRAGAGALPAGVHDNDVSVMTALDITHTTKHATAPDVSTKKVVTSQIRILVRTGREAIVRFGNQKVEPFEIGLRVSRLDGDRLQIDTRVSAGSPLALVGSPRLVVHDGEKGSVTIDAGEANGAFAISMTPKVVAGSAADAIEMHELPDLPSPPAQPLPAAPALPPTNALPPPVAPWPQALPAVPPVPPVPAPPPQRAL